MILTRQNLPVLDRGPGGYPAADGAARGGYVLAGAGDDADVLLIATGSEVPIALDARGRLAGEGITARVVSMPCREWFAQQSTSYRDEVLPPSVRAWVGVEAGIGQGWRDLVGDAGRIISLEHFGASADYQRLYQFGITADAVAQAARDSIHATSGSIRPGGDQQTASHGRWHRRPVRVIYVLFEEIYPGQ
jgi:transketolase